MPKFSRFVFSLFMTGVLITMAYVSSPSNAQQLPTVTPQPASDGFVNQAPTREPGLLGNMKIMWKFFFDKPRDTVPGGSIPVFELTKEQLLAAPDYSLYRLGHSTMLMKLQGEFWLTDPVFSERASPFQWMGPKRFHQPPISIADLPPIKGIILSHDHYDHLDYAAIMQLAKKTEHILTPTGVGDRLIKWGIDADKIQQLGWWQSTWINGTQFVATPAQHFSGRGLHDRDQTLWASWSILTPELKIFFSGDTGYFKGFKEIGDKYGPFDLTMVETGAYNKMWPDVHMQPEQSLQAHIDLRGKTMLPIHNGTFDLSMHSWFEPFERIVALAKQQGVRISTPQMGEEVDIAEPQTGKRWWLFPLAQASKPVSLQSALAE